MFAIGSTIHSDSGAGRLAFGLLLLLVPIAAAQTVENTSELRGLNIVHDGANLRIDVTLTAPVNPEVAVTSDPDRLVLDLPNTVANAKQRRIRVNWNDVARVRVGLNRANPPMTRVVVDLDSAHPYKLATTGNKIVLTVLSGTAQEVQRNSGPVPAASAPLFRLSRGGAHRSAPPSRDAAALPRLRTVFRVKAIGQDEVYLDGGRDSGLTEGMKLTVRESGSAAAQSVSVAELKVLSVADTTAVTAVQAPNRDVRPGDLAYLSPDDAVKARAAAGKDASPDVVAANSILPATDAESRSQGTDHAHIRGRVGFDNSGSRSSGSTAGHSNTMGFALRSDMANILGTHWNLQGYWRARLTKSTQPLQQTMEYYLDKAYTIQLYYDNPDSNWTAGFGRLYLPWATGLDTIDGGYVGRKVADGVTASVVFGSIPDLNTWHYSPNQQIAGGFFTFDGGSYDSFHYTSSVGATLGMVKWRLDRPAGLLENTLSYNKYLSVYHTFVVDDPRGLTTDGITPGPGISRSYLTVHIQPVERIGVDIVHNYFRDVPTLSTTLVSTGLVDKLLYQGVLGGVHLQATHHLTFYTSLGQGKKTGDETRSLNQVYGVTWTDMTRGNTRVDYHYSKFASSFAQGNYQALSFSRYFTNRVLWDVQVGHQDLVPGLTLNNRSTYIDTSFDTNIGSHSYLQSGYTVSRGSQLNYFQWYLSMGYRFDMKTAAR